MGETCFTHRILFFIVKAMVFSMTKFFVATVNYQITKNIELKNIN